MGLLGRRRGSANRVAEGGGEAPASSSPVPTKPKQSGENLELFGADSDESDDEAAIARYLDDVEGENAEDAADAESRKVSVLTSKVRAYFGLQRGQRDVKLKRCATTAFPRRAVCQI